MCRLTLTILLSLTASIVVSELRAGDLFWRGRANTDERYDLSDAVFILGHLFLGSEEPGCLDAADANDDGAIDLSDGIFILQHLFQGGSPPPPPEPAAVCPGLDPTVDELTCRDGEDPGEHPPIAVMYPVLAGAPGVRQRSRMELEVDDSGAYRVDAGTAFVILLEASSNRISRAPLSLVDPDDPAAGNSGSFHVICDRDLGDPAAGGIPASTNLASWFLRDIDLWEDRVFLLEHVALRVPGDGAWSPGPGSYRFGATVTDDECATSAEASFTLEVEETGAPELLAWVETSSVPGLPLQHDPGSGNVRLAPGKDYRLLVEGLPNGLGGEAPDPASLQVSADPPPRLIEPDLTPRFELQDGAAPRFAMSLRPGEFPELGNTNLTIRLASLPGGVRTIRFVLEVDVDYPGIIQPIWNLNCTGCHERPDPASGLELVGPEPETVRRTIVNIYAAEPAIDSVAPFLIRSYHPGQSYLFHKLQGTHLDPRVMGSGDRMPQDGGFLDVSAMHLIESWILQGAR